MKDHGDGLIEVFEDPDDYRRRHRRRQKGTGFHPGDPDWTRGREAALDEAEVIARRGMGMARKVTVRSAALSPQQED